MGQVSPYIKSITKDPAGWQFMLWASSSVINVSTGDNWWSRHRTLAYITQFQIKLVDLSSENQLKLIISACNNAMTYFLQTALDADIVHCKPGVLIYHGGRWPFQGSVPYLGPMLGCLCDVNRGGPGKLGFWAPNQPVSKLPDSQVHCAFPWGWKYGKPGQH